MKFLSLIIAFALIMLVVSSPLPKKDDGDDVSKDDSKAASKDDSKGDSKAASKDDSKDDSKAASKDDSKDDSKGDAKAASKDDSKGDSKAASKDDSKATSAAADAGGASILSSQNYSEFQISDGQAGNAEQEAAALFKGIDQSNLAGVSDADLKIIKGVHDVAEDAEVNAFNPAIAAASGADAEALQVGKIKNKVLKLTATVLQLQITDAKGTKDVTAKLEEEKTKLAKNIATDKKDSGSPSKSVTFDGKT